MICTNKNFHKHATLLVCSQFQFSMYLRTAITAAILRKLLGIIYLFTKQVSQVLNNVAKYSEKPTYLAALSVPINLVLTSRYNF